MGLIKANAELTLATSSIMIMMYLTTLIKVCRGSKYKFVIKLLILLIVSNICLLVSDWSFYIYKTRTFVGIPWFWISLSAISSFILLVCFNLSRWIFAFEYYSISRFMPYVLKGQDLPESELKFDTKFNNTMISINVAIPFFNQVAQFINNWWYFANIGGDWYWTYIVTKMLELLLQVFSGFLLGYGLRQIRKNLKSSAN
jgi:hypothetical protein